MDFSKIVFSTVLYSGIILPFVIILFSHVFIFYMIKLIKNDLRVLNRIKNDKYYPSKEEITNAKEKCIKDIIIFAVLLFEVIYRVLGFIDSSFVISKHHLNPAYRLSANCSIKNGTSIALLYNWGASYFVLIGANYASLLFFVSLLCILSMHVITMYKTNKPKQHKIILYLIFSITKSVLIPALLPFPRLLLFVFVFYLGFLIADYFLLLVLTKKLYLLIKRRCIDVKNHGGEEELSMLRGLEEVERSYKYFSLILVTGLAMQIMGEFFSISIETIIGSVLDNPCFFDAMYGINFKIDFATRAYGIVAIIATNIQFVSRNLFNIATIMAYCIFSWKELVKMYKQVRVYRYQVVITDSANVPLMRNHDY